MLRGDVVKKNKKPQSVEEGKYLVDDRPFNMRPEPREKKLSEEEIRLIKERHKKLGIED
mgnify:CR=1 FL=1